MKKITFLFIIIAFANVEILKSQTWVFGLDFQDTVWCQNNILHQYPSQQTGDTLFYSFDNDGYSDLNNRPKDWYITTAFATADSLIWAGDVNLVLSSSSAFDSVNTCDNWFITRSFYCASYTKIEWFSASFQSPMDLDGYEVLLSTSTNDLNDFNTILYTAAEESAFTGNDSTDFNSYDFFPTGAYVHGWNGSNMIPAELEYHGDSSRWTGVQTWHSIDLTDYTGLNIYLAFHHNSTNDNMISIDNIRVDDYWGIGENTINSYNLKIFPNPASEVIFATYNLKSESRVSFDIYDVNGKLVKSLSPAHKKSGNYSEEVQIADLSNGAYSFHLKTPEETSIISFIKK